MPDATQTKFKNLLGVAPPRAGHFIVSLYGDVVEPRGGTLWMGRVIGLCQSAGLSETLVRTAVSRLVMAGQLVGERVGRRSYYRLTPKARVEFSHAARVLFAPPETPQDFAVLAMPAAGLPHGFVAMRPELAFGPYRPNLVTEGQFVLRASVQQCGTDLADLVASLWDLAPLSLRYQAVLTRFTPLLELQTELAPQDALIARLLLIDDYRAAVLRDPMLPRAALPQDWPGWAARTLFVRLYLQLSKIADSYIQQAFEEHEGLQLTETEQVTARIGQLLAEAEGRTD
jgi:phenylacetic acid degradation operon negative regulatory protein